jgi:hypothetical protein
MRFYIHGTVNSEDETDEVGVTFLIDAASEDEAQRIARLVKGSDVDINEIEEAK